MAFAGNIVPDAITVEEGTRIPHDILTKMELYIKTMSETNCALRDAWRTKEEDYENRISKYEQESAKFLEEIGKEQEKQQACRTALLESETQVENLKNKLSGERQCRKALEAENVELCRLKDFAKQENVCLQNSLALSGVDVKRLEEQCKTLTFDLRRAADAKYEALAQCRDEMSAREAVVARHDMLEIELQMLRRHNQDLSTSLSQYKADLSGSRRDSFNRLAALDAQLVAKIEECTKQAKTIQGLQLSVKNAENMVKKLGIRLNEQQQAEIHMKEGFQKELVAITEVMSIYKRLSQDGESAVEDVLSKAKEMSQELEATISMYNSTQEKLAKQESEFKTLLSEKDKCIAAKEQEIKATYDLVAATIKEEMNDAMEKLPAKSELRRQLQDCGSMTSFIQHCSSLAEKLHFLKQENKHQVIYMKNVFEEIDAKAPMIKKQKEDYERAMVVLVEQSQQVDNLNKEVKLSREREKLLQEQLSRLKPENYSLQSQVADLGKQVCNLLHEVELARAGVDKSSKAISEDLVIFGSVEELQEQNRKLLELYAELNMPKESAVEMEDATMSKESLSQYEAHLKDVQEELENYKTMSRRLTEERNIYRKLYSTLIYGKCGIFEEEENVQKPSDCKVDELTKQLAMMDQEVKDLRMSSEKYDMECLVSKQAMEDEREQLNAELGQASDRAAQLYGQLQVCTQKVKMQEDALNAVKQQLAALELQNTNLCNRAADDKRAIRFFREVAQKWEQKATQQQEQAEQLRRELEEARAAARGCGPQFGSEDCAPHLGQHLAQLLEQLAAASAALERREEHQGASAEEQLNTAYQECLSLSSHLQEARTELEEERARLLTDIDASLKKVVAERKLRCTLEANLKAAREEIETKSREIIELNKRLVENGLQWRPSAPAPQLTSTPEKDGWQGRTEELEAQLAERLGEFQLLQQRLEEARAQAVTFSDMSERFERRWKEEADQRRGSQDLSDSQLREARQGEAKLRGEVKELTDRISRFSADGSEPDAQLQSLLEAAQVQLEAAQCERDALRDELHAAQQTISTLNDSLADMEREYRKEEVVHVCDSQAVARLKEELASMSTQLAALAGEKQAAEASLAEHKEQWAGEQCDVHERISHMEEQLSDLEAQNSLLHDQLEALGSRVLAHHSQQDISGVTSANSSVSSSFPAEEEHAPEQLMKVIQFLRKEKRAIGGKLSVARSENVHLKLQLGELEKRLEESKQDLVAAQKKVEVHVTAAMEQEERVKKAEMLFAMRDSNRMLREEREALSVSVRALTEEQEEAGRQLELLRAANRELQLHADKLSVESRAAQEEAARLRRQYGQLVESTARANREERVRLQQEREALCDQLAAKTRANEQVQVQLVALLEEKSKVEQQVEVLDQQHTEEMQIWHEKLGAAQQRNQNLTKELNNCRMELKENADILSYLREKLSANEILLEDMLKKQKQMEEQKKLEEVVKADNSAADSLPTTEAAGGEITKDLQERCSEAAEHPANQSDEPAAPGPRGDVEPTSAEIPLETNHKSPLCQQPASQSTECTALVAAQQVVHTTGPSSSPVPSQVEITPDPTVCQAAVRPTQLPQSASSPVQSTQAMELESSVDTCVSPLPEQADSSQSIEQMAVVTAGPQPAVKRSREPGDDCSSCSASDDGSLQVKRNRTGANILSMEENVEVVCEEVVSSEGVQRVDLELRSKEEVDNVPDSEGEMLGKDGPSVGSSTSEQDAEGSIVAEGGSNGSDQVSSSVGQSSPGAQEGSIAVNRIGQASVTSLTTREHLVQRQEVKDHATSSDSGDVSSSQTVSSVDSPGAAPLHGPRQETCVVVTEGAKTSQLAPGDANTPVVTVAQSSQNPSKQTFATGKKPAGPRTPATGSSEGRPPGEWQRSGSGPPQLMGRGMGPPGRRPPMLRYRGSPVQIVWPRSPGGRPHGRLPFLGRMVFRGRPPRMPMRDYDRQ